MVNKLTKSALDTLIIELNKFEEVIKFKSLDKLIMQDDNLKNKVDKLHEVSKQMTNAKVLGLANTYEQYKREYDNATQSLEDNVLLQMYLNASAETEELLNLVFTTIESEINSKLNE